jgi:hypothetical protein
VFVGRPEWQQKMKGIYLGDNLEEGLQAIDRLL